MIKKVKEILGSVRFWEVVGLAVVGYLQAEGSLPPNVADGLFLILSGSLTVGTLDSVGKKIGGK